MARWVPVSKDRHGAVRYRPLRSYAFAAELTLVPVCLAELSRLIAFYPLVFVSRAEGGFALCALVGLEPGRNLFVDPENGRWMAEYIPAVVRAYPFRLAPGSEPDQWVLCVDEESGTLHGEGEGTAFFDTSGNPSEFLRSVGEFLQQTAVDERRTAEACARLQAAGCIVPWPMTVRTAEGDRAIGDLHQVDEAALQALDAETLKSLRDAGALTLAYAQRFSAWQVSRLGRLMASRNRPMPETPPDDWGPLVTPSGELDLSFL